VIAFDFKTPGSMTGPGKELYKITNNAITNISYWTADDTWGSLDVSGSTFTPSSAGFYIERTVNRSPDNTKTESGPTAE
jgi:hypothetical protein